jgi:hypothetical protein
MIADYENNPNNASFHLSFTILISLFFQDLSSGLPL